MAIFSLHSRSHADAADQASQVQTKFILGWGVLLFVAIVASAAGAAIGKSSASEAWQIAFQVFAIGVVVTGACSLLGWLLGLLFGIPRSIARPDDAAAQQNQASAGGKQPTSRVNTNLEDISDWLTKTLIGVGLTQLNVVPQKLWDAAGSLNKASLNGAGGGAVFILGIALAGAAGGFWAGYVTTRTILTQLFDLFGRIANSDLGDVASAADPSNLQFDQQKPVQPKDPDIKATDGKLRMVSLDQLSTPVQMAAWGAAQARASNLGSALEALRKASSFAPNDTNIGALLKKVETANTAASPAGGPAPAPGPGAGPLNPAFLGHSIFTQFSVSGALKRYENYGAPAGSPAPTDAQRISRFISAMKDMQISSVFIQLFSRGGDVETTTANSNLRTQLIAALNQAGINWVGWGYCAGSLWSQSQTLIQGFKKDLGLTTFMLDIEPGNQLGKDAQGNPIYDLWDQNNLNSLVSWASNQFGANNLVLTTWSILQVQDSKSNPVVALMKGVAPLVGAFVPQAYWMNYPTTVHYNTLGLTQAAYPPNDPLSFVRMTIKSWTMAGFTTPLIIAGQAYWGEGGPDQPTMEGKVADFVSNFADWSQILGFSWYHAGQSDSPPDSMSDAMIASIKQAQLGTKPYQQPPAAVAGA